jgi:hypothetical protein
MRFVQLSACGLALFLCGGPGKAQQSDPAQFLQQRLFQHNASTMRVSVNGTRVTISYHAPDPRFRRIRAGDVLFEGRIAGRDIVGQAVLYGDRCPPVRYEVRGDLGTLDQDWFKLEGPVPLRDGNCRIRRFDQRSAHASLMFFAGGSPAPNGAVARTAPTPPMGAQADRRALLGTWSGQYACGTDQGDMRLSIEEAEGRLVATEQFSRRGYRHTIRHEIDVLPSNRIVVRPRQRAAAAKEFLFDGRNALNGRFVGFPQCRPIALSRQGQPAAAPVVTSTRFEPQSVRVGAIDARVNVVSPTCSASMTVRVESPDVRLFANRQALMAEVKPHIVNQLSARCPTLQTVAIEGLVHLRRVYQADMGRGSDWMLAARQVPLDDAIERLKAIPDGLQSLGQMHELREAAYRDFGGAEAEDAREFSRAVALRADVIARDKLPEFTALVAALDASPESLSLIDRDFAATVRHVEGLSSDRGSEYRRILDERRSAIRASIVTAVTREIGGEPATFENAHRRMLAAQTLADRYRDSIPEAAAVAIAAREQTELALRDGLPRFAGELSGEPFTFAAATRLSEQATSLALQARQFTQLSPYRDAMAKRRDEILAKLFEDARHEIARTGRGLGDIAQVMDLAAERGGEFRRAGDDNRGKGLRVDALARVQAIANENIEAFGAQLRAIGEGRTGRLQLERLRRSYGELASAVPAFEAYRQAVERRAEHHSQEACTAARQRSGQRNQDLDRMVVASTAISLGDLICRIDQADGAVAAPGGGIVTSLTGIFRSDFVLEYRSSDGVLSTITLRPSQAAGDAGALVGVSREIRGGTEPLSREHWLTFVERATRPRPRGLPTAGVTECDSLASDPDDPGKLAAGVRLDAIDTDRAVEACIAARELDPQSARLKFQLGRSLEAVGLSEDAKRYYEAAARQGHAAAHAALGAQLAFADQTKAEAIAHYERAVAQGYGAAREMLALLRAPRLIDFSAGWPERGRIELNCMALEEAVDRGGQNLHADNWEFVLAIDLDGRTASVTRDISWDALILFRPGERYNLSFEDGNIAIASAAGRVVLSARTLDLKYQGIFTLSGNAITFSANGNCHENIRQVSQ